MKLESINIILESLYTYINSLTGLIWFDLFFCKGTVHLSPHLFKRPVTLQHKEEPQSTSDQCIHYHWFELSVYVAYRKSANTKQGKVSPGCSKIHCKISCTDGQWKTTALCITGSESRAEVLLPDFKPLLVVRSEKLERLVDLHTFPSVLPNVKLWITGREISVT